MENASFTVLRELRRCVPTRNEVYLQPYSSDLNPIEELFAELKSFKRN
jgi:transposase